MAKKYWENGKKYWKSQGKVREFCQSGKVGTLFQGCRLQWSCWFLIEQLKQSWQYRLSTVNSNTVNSKFHFIRSFCEMFSYHFPIISCLKCMINLYFHSFRRKSLPMNDFELTVPDLYWYSCIAESLWKPLLDSCLYHSHQVSVVNLALIC